MPVAKRTSTAVHPLYLPPVYQHSVDHGMLILRDGSTATIRTAGPGDKEALRAFFLRLSPESRYHRFFSMAGPNEGLLDTLCDPDPHHQITLLAFRVIQGDSRIIAAASYMASGPATAEVAFAVDDAFHGKGIGTLTLERLALLAVRHGFLHFWATTHSDNKPMADIFRNAGFPFDETLEDGVLRFDFPVLPTQKFVERSEKLDRLFTVASLRPFFHPSSVAVVGASRDADSIGRNILDALIRCGFQGTVYPVNPAAGFVASMRVFKTVREIPETVDLAVVVAPQSAIAAVIDDCALRGVRAVLLVTAGYSDSGMHGRKLEQQLLEKVRGYGMRMVGPASMGLMSTHPEISLNASYLLAYPPHGHVALSSQSGAVALAILDIAQKRKLGLSSFVSVGNKADVSGNDLLQYWEDDPDTRAILLYLESFGNPRRFSRIARRVSRTKPIVCVKSGKSLPGTALSDAAVDALFQQTGVIRAGALDEMFDLALALGNQPLPRGPRTAILTNAAGPASLCRDMCLSSGLLVPELKPARQSRLKRMARGLAASANPVDLSYSARPEQYRSAIEMLLRSAEIDALIVIHVPFDQRVREYVEAIRAGTQAARSKEEGSDKPVLASMMLEQNVSPIALSKEVIPAYLFPESAARVLSHLVLYADWRKRPVGVFPDYPGIDTARRLCSELSRNGWIPESMTRKVMEAMEVEWRRDAGENDSIQLKVSVHEDPLFGPLISFALAGEQAEILGEITYRITPLTNQDAQDIIRTNRGYRLLQKVDGTLAADLPAIEELLLKISRLAEVTPRIREIVLTPVHAFAPGKGCAIGSARIRLGEALGERRQNAGK